MSDPGVYSVRAADLTIGEYEAGAYFTCPLCGPLYREGSLGGLSLPAAGLVADRHVTAKHDPGRFPYLSSPGGGV